MDQYSQTAPAISTHASGAPDAASCDRHLVLLARRSLASRRALNAALPSAIVNDHGLELLLMLFLAEADGEVATEEAMVADMAIRPIHTRRWLAALVQTGLAAMSGGYVALTRSGSAAVTAAMMRVRDEIYGLALVR